MEYPLNVQIKAPAVGFAVANDEDEHQALTQAGYEPAYVAQAKTDAQTVESLRAQLDELGIAYDKRSGVAKLLELLPE